MCKFNGNFYIVGMQMKYFRQEIVTSKQYIGIVNITFVKSTTYIYCFIVIYFSLDI